MREYLFQGKRLDNGEWVEGYYLHLGLVANERAYMIPSYASALYTYEVDPATVGLFIGHLDKHGKRIFEGHVLLVIRGGRKYVCAIKDVRNLPDCMFGSSVESIEIVSDIWDPFWQKGGGQA